VTSKRLAAALALIAAGAIAVVLARDDEPPEFIRAPPIERVIQDDAIFLHDPASLGSTLDEIRELGFARLRVTADWSVLAPAPAARDKPEFNAADPAAYDELENPFWDNLDRAVVEASRRGIEVMVDIGFWAPLWAAEPDAEGSIERPRTRIDAAEYADFARAVVQRYGGEHIPPGGEALPRVSMFTLWNEPNIPGFFEPQWERTGKGRRPASPHLYRGMVDAAYPAIKEARPDATVLVGALAARGSYDEAELSGGVPPLRFVRELACVDGRLEPLARDDCDRFRPVRGDGFSIHPYSFRTPPDAPGRRDNVPIGGLGRLIELLKALAARDRIDPKLVDVYITEFGYKTDPPDAEEGVSPEQQRDYWLRAEQIAASHPEVKMFAQFLVRDSVCEGCLFWPTGYRYGDGTPKPLMDALGSG